MSAAYLDLDWNTQDELESQPVVISWQPRPAVVRGIGDSTATVRCPECASIVYSRRHRLCGVCNQPLPDHLLFTMRDSQRVKQLMDLERARHRRWLEQRTDPVQ
jgi:hypothetical protein